MELKIVSYITKSQIPYVQLGAGKVNFPTFDAESKSAEIPNSLCPVGTGGGGGNW